MLNSSGQKITTEYKIFLYNRYENAGHALVTDLVAVQAPEMFEGHSLSEKIDVYSFGMLLWECFTGEVPWSDLDSPMQVLTDLAYSSCVHVH